MSALRYQVQVFERDLVTVAFELEAQLGSVPVVGGQVIRPAQGRTESRPWTIEVVDADGIITSHIGDPSTGRAWLHGRLVRVRLSVDGGPWVTLDTGRLTGLTEGDGPGLYTIQVHDERWVERQALVFASGSPTMQIYPAGTLGIFRGSPWAGDTRGEWKRTHMGAFGRMIAGIKLDHAGPISQETVDYIRNLVTRRDDYGADNTARLPLYTESLGFSDGGPSTEWGGEFPIVAISKSENDWVPGQHGTGLDSFDPRKDRFSLVFWVDTLGAIWRGGKHTARISAPEGPPTRDIPRHIGLRKDFVSGPAAGIDPFELVEQLYVEHGVRFNPTVLNALKHRYPPVSFRPTKVEPLARWLEDHIYGPLLVAAFTDSEGRVAPRSIAMPMMTQAEFDGLFEFNAGNLAEHPTWDHTSRDTVNVLNIEVEDYLYIDDERAKVDSDYGLDRLKHIEDTIVLEHDTLEHVPRSELTIQARGLWGAARDGVIQTLAREMFDRFGDGPIRGVMFGLRSTESVQPGDFVKINLETFPNPALNARGGVRIVQILSRIVHPDGFEFEFLDAGAALQPIPAPTIAVALNPDDPRHAVDVTISALAAGARATLQVSLTGDFSQIVRSVPNLSAGLTTIGSLPSGSPIYVRAVATMPERIRGVWSSTQSVTTDPISAPTGLTASDITRHTAQLTWTPGGAAYGIEVLVRQGSAPPQWTDEHVVAVLDPGALRYGLTTLAGPGIAHTAAVRHLDRFGGRSAVATRAITTTSAPATAPRPAGVAIATGGAP